MTCHEKSLHVMKCHQIFYSVANWLPNRPNLATAKLIWQLSEFLLELRIAKSIWQLPDSDDLATNMQHCDIC